MHEMGPAAAWRGRGRDLLDYRAGGDGNAIPVHDRGELNRVDEVQPAADGGVAGEATYDQHDRVQDGINSGQLRAPYESQRGAAHQTGGVHKLVGRRWVRDARGGRDERGSDLSQLASDLKLGGSRIHPRRARG